jgi:hypothetical protein
MFEPDPKSCWPLVRAIDPLGDSPGHTSLHLTDVEILVIHGIVRKLLTMVSAPEVPDPERAHDVLESIERKIANALAWEEFKSVVPRQSPGRDPYPEDDDDDEHGN